MRRAARFARSAVRLASRAGRSAARLSASTRSNGIGLIDYTARAALQGRRLGARTASPGTSEPGMQRRLRRDDPDRRRGDVLGRGRASGSRPGPTHARAARSRAVATLDVVLGVRRHGVAARTSRCTRARRCREVDEDGSPQQSVIAPRCNSYKRRGGTAAGGHAARPTRSAPTRCTCRKGDLPVHRRCAIRQGVGMTVGRGRQHGPQRGARGSHGCSTADQIPITQPRARGHRDHVIRAAVEDRRVAGRRDRCRRSTTALGTLELDRTTARATRARRSCVPVPRRSKTRRRARPSAGPKRRDERRRAARRLTLARTGRARTPPGRTAPSRRAPRPGRPR